MTTRIVTDANGRNHITNEPLLHPPKREWVGLTLEQYVAINASCTTVDEAVCATEKQLRENNT
jgi:hypothetical protein